jgi:hypothetical protein
MPSCTAYVRFRGESGHGERASKCEAFASLFYLKIKVENFRSLFWARSLNRFFQRAFPLLRISILSGFQCRVPGSIFSASDLQIGHVTIANFRNAVPYVTIGLSGPDSAMFNHQYMPAALTGRFGRDRCILQSEQMENPRSVTGGFYCRPEHSCRGVLSFNDEQCRRKQRECRPRHKEHECHVQLHQP